MAKPARFASIVALLPLIFSTCSLALANGAAPAIPFRENPILLFLSTLIAAACAMLWVPRVFKWNWETKYFGASLFHIGSIALLCVVPCLCLVLYSRLPITARISVLLIYLGIHVGWCRRFVVFYRKVDADTNLRGGLYQEEYDAVYYMQRADKQLLEHKFKELPKDGYFALFLALSFLLVPIMDAVSAIVGLPFVHIFLLIGMLPVSLMGFGFATRGWLVFYCYPMQIRKATGKRVYVDMTGKPDFGQRKLSNTL
jgi:hypothetical protein